MSILIKNAYIVTMVSPVSKADLYIEGNRITEIGIIDKKADVVIDGTGKVIMPGIVNGHTHVGMSLFRGYSDELELMDWLTKKIWPVEDRLSPEDVYYASLLSGIEMIKSGTTTFNDHYFYEEETAKAAAELGIRALLSRCIIGEGDETLVKFEEAKELYDSWNDKANGKIKVCVGLHAPYTCSQEVIRKASSFAKELNVPIHIHYLETTDEINQMRDRYNKTATEYLKETGIFDSKVILAHGVYAGREDLEFLKTVDAGVVHNPISNQKLGSGIIDLSLYREFGVPVGIGTDGQGSTNTLDMFEEIKSAAYLQKVTKKTATAISAYDVLRMATIEGAKVLGMENEIGSLEVGKKADIIIIDLNKPHLCPVHDIYSTLAYSACGSDVETVIIDGEIIMENRKIKTVDEVMVMEKVNETVKNLF